MGAVAPDRLRQGDAEQGRWRMPKYSAPRQEGCGSGAHSGPNFIQLFHYVKRSTSYHGLSLAARALLTEIH